MSSCLTGGTGRAYYGFDLENIVKWQSSTCCRTNSHSSSPSSTLSESSTISHRKPRTRRKRPNQTYNEAAAMLSTACPNIFPIKHLTNNTNISRFTKTHTDEPPELILIENSGFLGHQRVMEKPRSLMEPKAASFGWNLNRNRNSGSDSVESGDGYQDFDAESMLDEGIDSIMGDSNYSNSVMGNDECNDDGFCDLKKCYGCPMGMGIGEWGMRNGGRALRDVDEGDWWRFPAVEVASPAKPKIVPVEKRKVKKMEELMKRSELGQGNLNASLGPENGISLLLKLDYKAVLNAWSGKGSPLPEEISGSESPGGGIHTRLNQIDLFSKNGELKKSSTMRYKEKKRTPLCSKKIGSQDKETNLDRRHRSKGRFVRWPNYLICDEKT